MCMDMRMDMYMQGDGTPATYERLIKLPGCDGGNARYMMGHSHCNRPEKDGDGFLLGGTGIGDSGCEEFGFAYFDTTRGRERLIYFFLANKQGDDRYVEVVGCIERQGIDACTHLGEAWKDQPLPAPNVTRAHHNNKHGCPKAGGAAAMAGAGHR
jgi:hypothetical protein